MKYNTIHTHCPKQCKHELAILVTLKGGYHD